MRIIGPRPESGIYMETTRDEGFGVLPGEDRLVKEAMNPQVVTVEASMSIRDAAETMRRRHIPALVVRRGDALAGVLTERDIAVDGATQAAHPASVTIEEILGAEEPVGCRENAILSDVTRIMKQHHLQSIPVVDATGGVVGVLSLLDAAGAAMPAGSWRANR